MSFERLALVLTSRKNSDLTFSSFLKLRGPFSGISNLWEIKN